MIIREAKKKDCDTVASIHAEYFPYSALSKMGRRFLRLMYCFFVDSPDSFLLIAEEGGEIIGIVSGSKNLNKLQKRFILKNIFVLPFILFTKVISFVFWREAIEVLLYGSRLPDKKNIQDDLPIEEMTSLVVKKDYQKKGIGRALFLASIDYFRNIGAKEIKLAVGKNLTYAQSFYESLGCIRVMELKRGENKISYIYTFKL